jgi:hypothetical protein
MRRASLALAPRRPSIYSANKITPNRVRTCRFLSRQTLRHLHQSLQISVGSATGNLCNRRAQLLPPCLPTPSPLSRNRTSRLRQAPATAAAISPRSTRVMHLRGSASLQCCGGRSCTACFQLCLTTDEWFRILF